MRDFAEELTAMQRISEALICHIFFVHAYDWHLTNSAFYFVMKYYPNGSLQEWMEKRGCGYCGKIG